MAVLVARGDRVCNLAPTKGLSWQRKAWDDPSRGGQVPDMAAFIEGRNRGFVEASDEFGVTDSRFL